MVKTLADGTVREYHYVRRGGPQFWHSGQDFGLGSDEYLAAYIEAKERAQNKRGARSKPCYVPNLVSTGAIIVKFKQSAEYVQLAERTRRDYDSFLNSFEAEFGEDPIKMFEEPDSIAEIVTWKNKWSHSPKRYDYAGAVVTLLLNWAKQTRYIDMHHHSGVKKTYRANRAEIIWLPREVNALLEVATEAEKRVVIAASEGGLTPQDIGILTRSHVQSTPLGRRIYFRRTKSGKPVSIPVTPAMASVIDTTPEDQEYLITSLTGKRLTSLRASAIVRELKKRANEAAKADRTKIHIRDELRLNDMRGTAATALLRAGCTLNEIAVTMGWGIRHAANIIERYAALVPEVSDEVLAKLTAAKERQRQENERAKGASGSRG
ncbi:tyrosine-type recombinase/integrase [Rhodovulum tesquicola]|uniref:tyrosine-type recombinase/integrase n=1 Tax=Rhodovulum tesquicola TaxID=540254 RepID=UPI002096A6B5|nr:tyrosine-type recombinase/integrase [Rhodovulum tesquicola]